MARKSYHIIAAVNGGWKVIKSDAERSARNFESQKDAIKYGKSLSKAHAADLFIHGKDGRLSRKMSFATEPNSANRN